MTVYLAEVLRDARRRHGSSRREWAARVGGGGTAGACQPPTGSGAQRAQTGAGGGINALAAAAPNDQEGSGPLTPTATLAGRRGRRRHGQAPCSQLPPPSSPPQPGERLLDSSCPPPRQRCRTRWEGRR